MLLFTRPDHNSNEPSLLVSTNTKTEKMSASVQTSKAPSQFENVQIRTKIFRKASSNLAVSRVDWKGQVSTVGLVDSSERGEVAREDKLSADLAFILCAIRVLTLRTLVVCCVLNVVELPQTVDFRL